MEIIAYIIALLVPALALYLMSLLDLYGTGKYETFFICMGWGATIAFGLSFTVNNFVIGAIGYDSVVRFTAPVVEEFFKSIILWYFVTRPRFRYLVDGAVYGFAAGTGFAVIENFFYISNNEGALGVAISRVLTASLMHATASGLVGIGMGRLRRSNLGGIRKYGWPLFGMLAAMLLHMVYNNVVSIDDLPAQYVLLLGIMIGIGGSVIIGVIINQGLAEEKANFRETLGLQVGVTSAESSAVQQLGSMAMEQILKDLADFFGEAKADKIRQLLVLQANIGILQRNLTAPASERMKEAWRGEVAELRAKTDKLRNEIGMYVMSFLRGIFPTDDTDMWNAISATAAEYDPGHVHKFDVFMMASSSTLGAEDVARMERMGRKLQTIEIFQHVDLADLENLSRAIVERRYDDKALLFNQGDEGEAMYLIEQGGIDIFIVDDATKAEKFIRTYQRGAVVGEMALLDGQPRSATARTHGATELLVLRRSHFNMFVNSRPTVMLAVLRYLAEKVRYTTTVVEDAVNNAAAIARGDYAYAKTWAPERKELNTQQVAIHQALFTETGALEAEQVAAAAPQVLGGLFAALATALEEREAEVKVKK